MWESLEQGKDMCRYTKIPLATEWKVDQRRWARGWGLKDVAGAGHWVKEEGVGAEMLRGLKGWTAGGLWADIQDEAHGREPRGGRL